MVTSSCAQRDPKNDNGGLEPPSAMVSQKLQVRGAPSALICAARRLLCRAALFLWMTRLLAMRSMVAVSALSTLIAAAWSPAAMAFWTFLIALRKPVRRLTLAARCLTEVRARFAACLVLAMGVASFSRSETWGNARKRAKRSLISYTTCPYETKP